MRIVKWKWQANTVRLPLIAALIALISGHAVSGEPSSSGDAIDEDPAVVAAFEAALGSGNAIEPSQCEPIRLEACAKMAYRWTRMPNFFGDSNQIEALDRWAQYEQLTESRCGGPHLHAYLCELLAPVCIADEAVMRRFQIYPCRSFCRRLRGECRSELARLEFPAALASFDCDQLPYESNGGNGSLSGPCHEAPALVTPTSPAMRPVAAAVPSTGGDQAANGYRPYQPAGDNVPPFITDTSQLDIGFPTRLRRPTNNNQVNNDNRAQQQANNNETTTTTTSNQNNNQQHQWASQMQIWVQSVMWALARYSNVISIATVLCLLAALNSGRLRRLRARFASRRSSSSASSASSQRKLTALAGTYPPVDGLGGGLGGGGRALSPSASSRSLMLFAGNGKRPPTHQLVPPGCGEPVTTNDTAAPKMLLAGDRALHQPTLVNVNGTLDGHRAYSSKYHLSMMRDHQTGLSHHLAPGLVLQTRPQPASNHAHRHLADQRCEANPYDYIQFQGTGTNQRQQQRHNNNNRSVSPPSNSNSNNQQQQRSAEQQLYSNILLSSPSHSVLLFGSGAGQRTNPPAHQPPPPPSGAHHAHYLPTGTQ